MKVLGCDGAGSGAAVILGLDFIVRTAAKYPRNVVSYIFDLSI